MKRVTANFDFESMKAGDVVEVRADAKSQFEAYKKAHPATKKTVKDFETPNARNTPTGGKQKVRPMTQPKNPKKFTDKEWDDFEKFDAPSRMDYIKKNPDSEPAKKHEENKALYKKMMDAQKKNKGNTDFIPTGTPDSHPGSWHLYNKDSIKALNKGASGSRS